MEGSLTELAWESQRVAVSQLLCKAAQRLPMNQTNPWILLSFIVHLKASACYSKWRHFENVSAASLHSYESIKPFVQYWIFGHNIYREQSTAIYCDTSSVSMLWCHNNWPDVHSIEWVSEWVSERASEWVSEWNERGREGGGRGDDMWHGWRMGGGIIEPCKTVQGYCVRVHCNE